MHIIRSGGVPMTKDFPNEKGSQIPEPIAPDTEFNDHEVKKDQHKYKRDQQITLDPRENNGM